MELPRQQVNVIVVILLLIMPIVGMAIDLIAPSLPAITHSLGVAESMTQNLVSLYVIGYALGCIITGFLADAWGRRKLLCVSLAAFAICSFLPIIFSYISILLVVRLIQGITLGACAILARTAIADILPAEELVKVGATMGIMWGAGPVIGPVIGSYLQTYFGWHACFYFFSITVLVELLLVLFLVPETNFNRQSLQLVVIKQNVIEVFSNKLFVGMVVLMGLMYSIVTSFHTVGPFLIQNLLHYSPLFFGRVALVLGIVYFLASLIGKALIKRFDVQKIFFTMLHLFAIVALISLVLSYYFANSIVLIASASGCMFILCAILYPLAMGKGLALFKHISGTASAVMFTSIIISSLVSFLLSLAPHSSIILLMSAFFIVTVLSVLVYWFMVHNK